MRAADIEPLADDADALHVHAWCERRFYVISAAALAQGGKVRVVAQVDAVYEFPEYLIADDA